MKGWTSQLLIIAEFKPHGCVDKLRRDRKAMAVLPCEADKLLQSEILSAHVGSILGGDQVVP